MKKGLMLLVLLVFILAAGCDDGNNSVYPDLETDTDEVADDSVDTVIDEDEVMDTGVDEDEVIDTVVDEDEVIDTVVDEDEVVDTIVDEDEVVDTVVDEDEVADTVVDEDEVTDDDVIIDPCDPNPCTGITNSNETCVPSGETYTCECESNYTWNDTAQTCDFATQREDCTNIPLNASGTLDNSDNKFEQTWDGDSWEPEAAAFACTWECSDGYILNRDMTKCITPTIYVNVNASGADTGISWTDALTDLSEAMALSEYGQEIWVAMGLYHPTACPNLYVDDCTVSDRRNHFSAKQGVKIYGGFLGTEATVAERNWKVNTTTLSGDYSNNDSWDDTEKEWVNNDENVYHVFYHDFWIVLDDTAIVDGFTITGGNANGAEWPHEDGGGMHNTGDTTRPTNPTIRNCTFFANTAIFGGGVHNHDGAAPLIDNCRFEENIAEGGGAIYNQDNTPTISNTVFVSNRADGGSAIYSKDSDPTVDNCTFETNIGTALHQRYGTLTLTNSTFTGNTGENGGAIQLDQTTSAKIDSCYFEGNSSSGIIMVQVAAADISNSVFIGNSSPASGGAILNMMSNPTITNCSFTQNSADIGGAIANAQANPIISNSILWGNTATTAGDDLFNAPEGDYFGMYFTESFPVFNYNDIASCGGSAMTCGAGSDESCWVASFGIDGGGNIDEDPLFTGPPTSVILDAASPCVDSGDNSFIPAEITTDIIGNDRIVNTTVDMGAYEKQ